MATREDEAPTQREQRAQPGGTAKGAIAEKAGKLATTRNRKGANERRARARDRLLLLGEERARARQQAEELAEKLRPSQGKEEREVEEERKAESNRALLLGWGLVRIDLEADLWIDYAGKPKSVASPDDEASELYLLNHLATLIGTTKPTDHARVCPKHGPTRDDGAGCLFFDVATAITADAFWIAALMYQYRLDGVSLLVPDERPHVRSAADIDLSEAHKELCGALRSEAVLVARAGSNADAVAVRVGGQVPVDLPDHRGSHGLAAAAVLNLLPGGDRAARRALADRARELDERTEQLMQSILIGQLPWRRSP